MTRPCEGARKYFNRIVVFQFYLEMLGVLSNLIDLDCLVLKNKDRTIILVIDCWVCLSSWAG